MLAYSMKNLVPSVGIYVRAWLCMSDMFAKSSREHNFIAASHHPSNSRAAT